MESHNLTSYLPMFLLVLKDSECASVAVQRKWLRGRKDYESNVLISDFGGAIGGQSREATVLQPKWFDVFKRYEVAIMEITTNLNM
jgi:hypothetical protein